MSLLGVAPDRVYIVKPMSPWAGCALAAPFHPCRPNITRSGERTAVSLCCTCPGVTPGGRYPLSLPCGARTFLIWVLSVPIRGCPPRSRIYCTSWGGKSQMSCKFFSERIYYIICLPVQLSITYTNWDLKREVRAPNNTVIPNQCAHWCGNLHRIPGSLSSYIPLFCTICHNLLTKIGSSNRGIATPGKRTGSQ